MQRLGASLHEDMLAAQLPGPPRIFIVETGVSDVRKAIEMQRSLEIHREV
jgi:hypothetical protein